MVAIPRLGEMSILDILSEETNLPVPAQAEEPRAKTTIRCSATRIDGEVRGCATKNQTASNSCEQRYNADPRGGQVFYI
jgi:hypothetical protein